MIQPIKDSDLTQLTAWSGADHIDQDLLLLDSIGDVPVPHDARRMNFILIALCTHGTIEYSLDTRQIVVTPGQLLVVSERSVVDKYQASPDVKGLAFLMSVEFFNEVIRDVSALSAVFLFSRSHPVLTLTDGEGATFRRYFYAIKARVSDVSNHFRRELVSTLLLALFYDLSNVIYQFQNNAGQHYKRGDVIFTQFIKMVEANCRRERRVSWYAEQMGITPKYLSETVKTISQRSPGEWVDYYVVLELRLLLKNTAKSIKEITKDMNFPNQSFLGKYFKEHVGISPSKYRRRR